MLLHEARDRESLIATAVESVERGLNELSSGNLSLRVDDGLLLTPSAIPFARLGVEDLVKLSLDGEILAGGCKPSSEWPFHTAILQVRPDVNAIVHTHSVAATAYSCLRQPIPAFHYMVAALGGYEVPCSGYATPGTRELAELAVDTLGDLGGCLLANHGVLAVGDDLDQALARAQLIETLAEQYSRTLQLGGAVLLSDAEMSEMLEAFRYYGKS